MVSKDKDVEDYKSETFLQEFLAGFFLFCFYST